MNNKFLYCAHLILLVMLSVGIMLLTMGNSETEKIIGWVFFIFGASGAYHSGCEISSNLREKMKTDITNQLACECEALNQRLLILEGKASTATHLAETFKVGSKVMATSLTEHKYWADFYPPVGTIGEVKRIAGKLLAVRWPAGTVEAPEMAMSDGTFWVEITQVKKVEENE